MENPELDRVKSLEMLRELQVEHKSIKNNPELVEIQQKVSRAKKREENLRYKNQIDMEQMQELRQKFQNALNKLNSTSTRQVALREAKDLIKAHNSMESLKIYVGSLTEHRKSKDSSARELEVSLLGYLSQVYKENLVEEGGSLRLLIRLAEVIQGYYKDLNRGVHRAAGTALCEIYRYSLPKSTQSIIFSFMYDPVHSILTTGIDVQVQGAAALTLFIWIEYLKEDNDQGNLVLVYSKVLPLFVKLRAEFVDLLNAIGLLSETCGFSIIIEHLNGFLSKMVSYLKHPSNNAHPLKTAACQLLAHVGKYLLDTSHTLDPFPSDILTALREVKTEKVPVLQNKARECLKTWEIFRASGLEQPVNLSPAPKVFKRIEPENHFKSIRNLVKLQKEKLKTAEEKKVPESHWGLPKAGYLKKGSGNYFNVATQENYVNVNRSAEKKLSVVNEIRKRQLSPESLKVLYKEGSRVMVYEDENEKIHEESLEENKDLQDFKGIKANEMKPVQRKVENYHLVKKSEQQNSKVDESTEGFRFQFEENHSANESINFAAKRKAIDEKSSCKETDYTEAVEKKIEEVQEVNEPEEQMMFHFVREESKSTEILNPYNYVRKKSGNEKVNFPSVIKEEVDHFDESATVHQGLSVIPSSHNLEESNGDEIKNIKLENLKMENKLIHDDSEIVQNFIQKDPKSVIDAKDSFFKGDEDNAKNLEEQDTKVQIETKNTSISKTDKTSGNNSSTARTAETNLNTKTPNTENKISSIGTKKPETETKQSSDVPSQSISSQSQNKIQTMKSQTIEIKPVIKRRSIIRDLSIQYQEPFKINQPEFLSPKPNLHISKQSEYKINGIHSKEVQTSINFQDTPRFSISLVSEHIETQNTSEIFEPIVETIEEIQAGFEEKFLMIENELKKMDERLTWVDDSCKCVKKYSNLKKNLLNTSKISDKSEQTDPDKQIVPVKPVKDNTIDKLTQTWSDILQIAENGNLSQAYNLVLNTSDDLYLLRLMFKTEPCVDLLNSQVNSRVFEKLTGILDSKFVENVGIEWISVALQEGLDLNEDALYGLENIVLKGGREGKEAKQILEYLKEN